VTWLIAYLVLGAVVLGIALVSHRLANPPQSDFVREMMEAVEPTRATLRYKLLHRLVVPALAGALMLVAWPAAVFIKVREMVAGKPAEAEPEAAVFCVTHEHLLQETTVEEIETAEIVRDPLGAAPPLPFGHLNAAWSRFKCRLAPGDAVWRFSARWDEGWGRPEIREGYVVVRADGVGAHFETARRIVDSPASGSSRENP
jgi:hypothetical protein